MKYYYVKICGCCMNTISKKEITEDEFEHCIFEFYALDSDGEIKGGTNDLCPNCYDEAIKLGIRA